MRFEHELRVRLRERRNRLYRSGYQVFTNEETLMVRWMESESYLAALLAEIDAAAIDFGQWKASSFSRQELEFPDDELQRAKVCLGILREHDWRTHAHMVSNEHKFDAMLSARLSQF